MRFIVVGDPHVRPSDLDDAEALMGYATKLALEHNAQVLLLGDLHHYHGVIHAEVLAFWHRIFKYSEVEFVALVGNHDMTGVAGSRTHALMTHHRNDVTIIQDPTVIGNVIFAPYCSNEHLESIGQTYAACPTMICHATFNGSQYENGFFAKDGLDPDRLPQGIISGHIHAPQQFGKVWYPGAPRALTVSDANIERFAWLVEFNTAGYIVGKTGFSLREVCRQLYHLQDSPATPLEVTFDPRHKYHVDITGPASWIAERKPLFEGKARVRTFRTDKPTVKLKESEGIGVSFGKYFTAYKPQYGTDADLLKQMLKERTGLNVG